ncbi:MAG: type VII toxin-antitoxin system HepT family RNase toxin [Planctomycetota bacterium]
MIRNDSVLPRLKKLDEYLDILRDLRQYNQEEFIKDPEHYGSAERFLHLTIEALNDVGNHIVADQNWGDVEWYSDIPKRLYEHDVIDESMKDRWTRMIGFRNILVHDYLDLDHKKVYVVIQNNLDEIDDIKRALTSLL